ncbi:MAG: glycoside hydrolase family 97 catalytic domain-containing protein [Prevotella sp.]|nr:glycoside hydrolase family 97 catalytic domain-containing protein [Prevotella sp.]
MRKLFLTLLLLPVMAVQASDLTVISPNGKMQIVVHAEQQRLTWEVSHGSTSVLAASEIGINGALSRMKGKVKGNAALLSNAQYAVEFRADNDAAAYRITVKGKKAVTINNETAEFRFAEDYPAFIPYVNNNRSGERWCYSFESYYDEQPLSKMFADSLATNPLAVRLPQGKLAVVLDADVTDYPGMFLKKAGPHGLQAEFAPYPLKEINSGHARLNLIPTERANYIAKATRTPWRIVAVTENDKELLNSDIARRYGPTCRLTDTSWIRPGKVAWDWWNATMLTGVDFRAGMNTDTYKYYIDFASKNHLEYIIIDEGWSSEESLTEKLNPEIDLSVLIPYAKQRNVGIILWSSWRNSIRNTEQDFKHYADMGIAGFKVDFFDRDDQVVIRSIWQIADCAARNHLLLDLHGFRPTGIQYAYPNIVNFEGVMGLENCKWEPRDANGPLYDHPRYDVIIPYLRMLIGPLDYTPGAMSNATRAQFFGNNDHPMSQGTRAHQVAMYITYNAPLQMLADSPSKYMKEQETTDYISQIPTVFDEVLALDGKMGEYTVIAKRKGSKWYLSAMTNWQARDLSIDLSMLSAGRHQAEIFADGINADRDATDYKRSIKTVSQGDVLKVHLAPGGGWNMITTPQ